MSEIQQMDSPEVPVCVFCGKANNGGQLLVPSDAAGGPIHERECWYAYLETPEYKARNVAAEEEHAEHVGWVNYGTVLGSHRKALTSGFSKLQFDVGDWLVTGEDRGYIGVTNYAETERLTGYKVSCLRKFATIARRVPEGMRIPSLPWAAHQAVAYIADPEQRKQVLKHAVAEGLSVAGLRRHIKTLSPKQQVAPKTIREHNLESTEGHAALARQRLEAWDRALSSPEIGDELMAAMPQIRNREQLAERLKKTAALLIRYAEIVTAGPVPEQAETAMAGQPA